MIVQKKFYSHSNLTSDCSKIIRDIAVNKEVFTHIVGINRGGLIAGLMLSHYYDIPLVPFHISLRDHKTIENEEVIYDIFKNENNRILIVDDICDSGDTLSYIYENILNIDVTNPRVKTAVLVYNLGCKNFEPTYHGYEIDKDDHDCWIVFWWENWWE